MGGKVILGIDPGKSGAIVKLVQLPNNHWSIDRVFRLSRDEEEIAQFIYEETWRMAPAPDLRVMCYMEKVHGYGVGRSFNFGKYYGFVRGCLYVCGLKLETGSLVDVTPQKWMAEMQVPPQKGNVKQHRLAMKMMAERAQSAVTATDWNAAAILISLYGLRQEGGKLDESSSRR